MIDFLGWFAMASGIIAAVMVSIDAGRKITGWGFVVFTAHIEVHRRDPFDVVHDAVHLLEDRYGIEHAAIHPERVRLLDIEDGGPREPASDDVRAAESA